MKPNQSSKNQSISKGQKSKESAGLGPKQPSKKEQSGKQKAGKANKYKMDFIKKDNYDTMNQKFNIT